jgi:protein-tyrosine phosphatase
VKAGITKVVATPHVDHRYGLSVSEIEAAAERLAEALEQREIALQLALGAEIAVSRLLDLDDDELGRLQLGDSPYLLVEAPLEPVLGNLEALVARLIDGGHRVLLAHPERCPALHRDPARVAGMAAAGALCSVTAGSFAGRFGAPPRALALDLLDRGLVHNVTSDAHDAVRRPPDLLSWVEATEGRASQALARWLTADAPAAILDGAALPERPPLGPPPRPPRRGLRRLVSRRNDLPRI